MKTLTKSQQREPLYKTFGRLKSAILFNKDIERAGYLIEKLENDLRKAKVEENIYE